MSMGAGRFGQAEQQPVQSWWLTWEITSSSGIKLPPHNVQCRHSHEAVCLEGLRAAWVPLHSRAEDPQTVKSAKMGTSVWRRFDWEQRESTWILSDRKRAKCKRGGSVKIATRLFLFTWERKCKVKSNQEYIRKCSAITITHYSPNLPKWNSRN